MSSGFFSIGISGLNAAQLGLLTTEHNVVNANTPGYTRQRTVQGTNVAVNTGAGALGQGVHVQTIERMYDKFLTGQVNSAQTQVSELDTYYSQIKQIDGMLADPNSGLSPALQSFFAGVQQVAANPSLLPARQSMITSSETLVSRFHDLDSRLSELSDQVNGRITSAVSEINTYASMIADVNQRIVISESGYGQPANDLLDQRDQLVSELNKLVKVSTNTNSDGTYNIFIGSGQQLVVGTQVMEMTATPSASDPLKIVVGLKTAGASQELPDSLLSNGGELGGLLNFRNESLDPVTNELGRVAASLALTFNAQLGLGQDLLGNASVDGAAFVGALFKIPDPTVIPKSPATSSLGVAFVNPPNPPVAPTYSGNFYTDLKATDYKLAYDGTTFTLTRMNDGVKWTSNSIAGINTAITDPSDPQWNGAQGITLSDNGIAAGNEFLIKPVGEIGRNIDIDPRIAADPRLIAAAAPIRTVPSSTNTGSMKISQGVIGVGYTVAGAPYALAIDQTDLKNVPGNWIAVYSDGTQVPGTGDIPLANAGKTLASFSFNNMSFNVSGTPPAAGADTFSIERNASGVQDGRNAVLFAKLQTQNTVAGGKATFQSAYASLVADNGIRTREAKVQLDAQTAVLTQSQDTRDSLSGVNLDEEAANMLKYQQAYQASSKILEIGNKLFDTILALG